MGLFDGLKNQSRKPKDQEGNAAESEQIGYNPENAPVIERDPNVSRETIRCFFHPGRSSG